MSKSSTMSLSSASSTPTTDANHATIWCRTSSSQDKVCYQWTIDTVCLNSKMMGQSLKSSTFSENASDKRKWQFELYPNGKDEATRGYLSILLTLQNPGNVEFNVTYKYGILNTNGQEKNVLSSTRNYRSGSNSWGFMKFIKLNYLLDKTNGLLHDSDQVTIICDVSVLTNVVNVCSQSNTVQFKVPESKLNQDFENLFEKAEFSDVTFAVDDRELHAHKAILAARSEVFAAMFKHEWEESKLNRVPIVDMDYKVLREILIFIYTDKSPNINKMAFELLAAADLYALEKLKVMCEEVLYRNLSIATAVDTLVLAERHSAEQLKAHTKVFIQNHNIDVIESDGWQKIFTSLH